MGGPAWNRPATTRTGRGTKGTWKLREREQFERAADQLGGRSIASGPDRAGGCEPVAHRSESGLRTRSCGEARCDQVWADLAGAAPGPDRLPGERDGLARLRGQAVAPSDRACGHGRAPRCTLHVGKLNAEVTNARISRQLHHEGRQAALANPIRPAAWCGRKSPTNHKTGVRTTEGC